MILVTGSAGFIGFHVVKKLIIKNKKVIGIDNLNSYYDKKLKKSRNKELQKINNKNYFFHKIDLKNEKKLSSLFKKYKFKKVIHLAAQAGVRYSFINPNKYIDSNITGFTNILEYMKSKKIKKLVYASSSSVYGNCKKFPFRESFDFEKNVGRQGCGCRFGGYPVQHTFQDSYRCPKGRKACVRGKDDGKRVRGDS